MAKRIKVKFKDLKKFEREIANVLSKDPYLPETVEKVIRKRIVKGISPVKGQGRFKRYSSSYQRQIKKGKLSHPKRIRPVNMTLSGEMMRGFYVERSTVGKFRIGFRGPHGKLADIHNSFGPGGRREYIRRLLPSIRGEKFTRSIENEIIEDIKAAILKPRFRRFVKKYFKK